jgi:CubicO group peptidase (beta-lactamase class C family)
LEKYFGTHTATTPWQWASAGKTITSFMTGIAQQEGYLSISDTTSNYLGQGWTICTPQQEEKITIRNQLTMTSGLNDDVPDHYCTLDTCLIYQADAGTRWAYHNGPYTLLDSVIEVATGQTLNSYTTQKLKNPTGMTGAFFPVGYNNVFFSNARRA